jgi:neutral amino acid transport system ATP-binding protein
MSILQVSDVYAGYKDVDILRGINLHVDAGEIVTIIGPNGAGKSTLIKAVVQLLVPRTGRVEFEGKNLVGIPCEQVVRMGIAYVPQVANVFPALTVFENLELALPTAQGLKAEVDRVLELFPQLTGHLHRPARVLSGGERQLLAMARGLMTRPRLMLLDEPSAALSPLMMKKVFEKIQEINRSGTAILLVEQNAKRALALSHRAYVLETGQNALEGPADVLLNDPRIGELYLGGKGAKA